jgi:hypothetical protein
LRTKSEVLELHRAAGLARQRMRRLRLSNRRKKPGPLGPLVPG